MTHTNRFDLDLKFGQSKENELQIAIEGQVECKADRLTVRTGNVYVEIESRGKPSGIMVTTSKYYAICLVVEERKKDIWTEFIEYQDKYKLLKTLKKSINSLEKANDQMVDL